MFGTRRFPLRRPEGEGEQNGGQAAGTTNNEGDNEDKTEITNSQAKKLPWVRDMSAELAELRREKNERDAAAAKADSDKAAKELEDKQQYEEAAKTRAAQAVEEALKKRDAEHSKELQRRDLKAELSRLGFQNKKFIKGAIVDFKPDTDSVEDFAKAIFDDPENASFLAGAGVGGEGGNADALPRGDTLTTSFTPAKLDAWSKSDDPKKRAAAVKYKGEYFDRHGKLPS